jgi:hypothetical protein
MNRGMKRYQAMSVVVIEAMNSLVALNSCRCIFSTRFKKTITASSYIFIRIFVKRCQICLIRQRRAAHGNLQEQANKFNEASKACIETKGLNV